MRSLRLVAAAAVSALVIGAGTMPARAAGAPSPVTAGPVVAWSDGQDQPGEPGVVPDDLDGPVTSVTADVQATGAVTLDGKLRVWGDPDAGEVADAPGGVTDAKALALSEGHGAVLHADGRVSAWGTADGVDTPPSDLRAEAIALQWHTGYAVRTDGTLAVWGMAPAYAPPSDLTDLTDVSVGSYQALALHADGTVDTWGNDAVSGLTTLPDFGGKKVVQIAAGELTSGVVLADGTISIWGPQTPPNAPDFDGLTPAGKVVSLSLSPAGRMAAAVTADGVVHVWGPSTTLSDVPQSLTGQPVAAVALGMHHVAVVVTTFRKVADASISGVPQAGQTLTATPATYSLTPDAPPTGQWFSNNVPISGRTGSTLPLGASLAGASVRYESSATRGDITAASTSQSVTVARIASVTKVSVTPTSSTVGHARIATATVTTTAGTATGTVTFTVGTSTKTVALAAGGARWTLPFQAGGNRPVTATYNGSSSTDGSRGSTFVKVVKATSKTKITAKAAPRAKRATVSISVMTAKGLQPGGKAKVSLVGKTRKTLTAVVNAKGKAVANLKGLKPGKYTVTVRYAGNGNVSASVASAKFKI
jgi:Big-like domain-containing protein